jgi:hypothetical protein
MLYWLATASPPWTPCAVGAQGTIAPGTQCYRRGTTVVELLLSGYDVDVSSLRAAVQRVRDGGGQARLTPRAAAALGPGALDDRVRTFD